MSEEDGPARIESYSHFEYPKKEWLKGMDVTLEEETVDGRKGNVDYFQEVPTKVHQESKNDQK
jgi:hypothetical protein